MKTIVTGGSGFLGTHLREIFQADDFSRRSGYDVLNLNDTAKISDYDLVIHLAAHLDKSPDGADECFLTNVEGTINVLRAVSPNAAFIFASTRDVYGRNADDFDEVPENCSTEYVGQTALEWSKLIAERYVEFYAAERGFRSCIFRLSTVVAAENPQTEGNFINYYIEAVRGGEELILPAYGAPLRDLLAVKDFARACRLFADSDVLHGLYNLGGGRENALTLRQIIAKIENLTGAKAIISEKNAALPTPRNYVTSLEKIYAELGFAPQISIDKMLAELV